MLSESYKKNGRRSRLSVTVKAATGRCFEEDEDKKETAETMSER